MYQLARPLFMYCETPLHAGSSSKLGLIDLPIQRERHTDFPKIEGSSLKGALRERFEQQLIPTAQADRKHQDLYVTFGPEGDDLYAGALGFTDARLLIFPVKSMKGIFAWVTCQQVLKRFAEDMKNVDKSLPISTAEIPEVETGTAKITNTSKLKVGNEKIILEEYAFEANPNEITTELANWFMENLFSENSWWQQKIAQDLVILSNDDFKDFVNLSTEVITRTKIDNSSGTVEDGALFTEEYLPSESIMYSLVLAAPVFPLHKPPKEGEKDKRNKLSNGKADAQDVLDFFKETLQDKANDRFQAGGNSTLGKGLISTSFIQ